MKYKIVFLLFFIPLWAASQSPDSAYAEREQLLLDGVKYDYNIIKWNLPKLFVGGFNVIYERRANLNISYLLDVEWNPSSYRASNTLSGGIRYYYNLEKRILKGQEKGEKTHCMSANYFQADFAFGSRYGEVHLDNDLNGFQIGPTIKIGKQRKVWKHCYYDFWIGYQIPLLNRKIEPGDSRVMRMDNVKLGFAFGVGI